MSFVIRGLDRAEFAPLFGLSDAELAERGIIARTADVSPGYPCRITLDDAEVGERVLLLNYESHKAATPYRSAFAIYVREAGGATAHYIDELPPVMRRRPIALRLFDKDGMLIGADLGTGPNEIADKINAAFSDRRTVYIHAHNAMHGCYAAEIRPA